MSAIALLRDPADATKSALFVGGKAGHDAIVVKLADVTGRLSVTVNGVNLGAFRPTGGVYVSGLGGNDTIRVTA